MIHIDLTFRRRARMEPAINDISLDPFYRHLDHYRTRKRHFSILWENSVAKAIRLTLFKKVVPVADDYVARKPDEIHSRLRFVGQLAQRFTFRLVLRLPDCMPRLRSIHTAKIYVKQFFAKIPRSHLYIHKRHYSRHSFSVAIIHRVLAFYNFFLPVNSCRRKFVRCNGIRIIF